ncbi:class I SAM-dependent methyltransferase [Wukongibacter sp. M2B1]|uniref:class I SAM-dependent methyltransferase n=1 Tax=Wukongibacter sp. M2B1 TaxID=3088895 RepID=UPI003D7ACDAB
MNRIDINSEEIKSIFASIGLSNKEGINYKQRLKKHRQITDFLVHIEKAVKKLSQKRTLVLLDCASGKSYLSFIANYYLTNVLERKVEFICIDYNNHVMEQSEIAAKNLGFNNMSFICDDIFNVRLTQCPDIVYSLHACNMATDMTIAKGIAEQAKYIMTVSCCQHFIRSNMKKHPLRSITKFGVYKERIADMLSDTMRSLILEIEGYEIDLFDYVPASETPKNVMIRAKKGSCHEKRSQQAQNEYKKLKEMFNVEPKLIKYLSYAQVDKNIQR